LKSPKASASPWRHYYIALALMVSVQASGFGEAPAGKTPEMNEIEKPMRSAIQNDGTMMAPFTVREKRLLGELPRETLVSDQVRFRVDLSGLLDRHDMVWGKPDGPPADWKAGAPIGNGDFGAMVYGYPDALSFVLGKNGVWNRQNDTESFFPGDNFAELRQAFLESDEAAFKSIIETANADYSTALPHLTTSGTLRLHVDEGKRIRSVKMRVVLQEGRAHLSWNKEKVSTLVSRRHDVMLIDIAREGENRSPVSWELSRPILEGNPPPDLDLGAGACFLTLRFAAGGKYTIGLTALAGSLEAEDVHGRLVGFVEPASDGACTLLLTIASTDDAEDTIAECRRRLGAAREAGARAVETDHLAWWQDYWMRGLASVGDPAVETWYYRSLYLCGSLLRPGLPSPGLQGLWVGENVPPWSADFHTNVNIQCVYWGLLTNNRLDLMEPYLNHYHETADAARRDASDYFQMRGLRFPHGGSIGGHETTMPKWAILATDVSGSAWVTQLFWQYFEWTQDHRFLKETAYPLLRDVALFYADYLLWNDEKKQWDIAPSVHFESKCPHFEAWGYNSLYTQAMFRGAFVRAIAAAKTLGIDPEHIRLWQERLDNLAPVPTTEEGFWKAMQDREPYYEGHNYMLPLVFPAELVSRFHGPPDLLEQARRTLKEVRTSHPGYDGGPGFGGQALCEVLRIDESDWVFNHAGWTEESGWGENILSRDWRRGIFQSDIGPGMCRVLADMCLLGLGGVIHLFPGIPEDVPARIHSLRAPGAFLVSAEKRAHKVDYVLVQSLAGGVLKLESPWPQQQVDIADSNGQPVETIQGAVLEISTEPQEKYLIVPTGLDPAAIPLVDFALD
jgi:hypothetical protein